MADDPQAQAASRNGSCIGRDVAADISRPIGAPTSASSELWISLTPVSSATWRAVGVYSLLETTHTTWALRRSRINEASCTGRAPTGASLNRHWRAAITPLRSV